MSLVAASLFVAASPSTTSSSPNPSTYVQTHVLALLRRRNKQNYKEDKEDEINLVILSHRTREYFLFLK